MAGTELNQEDQASFDNWLTDQSTKVGRDMSNDMEDYDLKGWWQKNGSIDLGQGHLTDEFKLPNHPTFSDQSVYHGKDGNEGGSWTPLQNGQWLFMAGKTNKENFSPQFLQKYFDKVEPNNILAIPADTDLSDIQK